MLYRICGLVTMMGVLSAASLHAAVPPLLAKAVEQWDAGRKDLAFTQQTRMLGEKDQVLEERVERYDPSLTDNQRWKLISVNGKAPTDEQIKKIQDKRNNRPRKKGGKPVSEYLDLEHAKQVEDGEKTVRFEVGLRPESARLIAVDKLIVVIAVDKKTNDIAHIAAMLREPMRIALGLAKITDVDFDLHVEAGGAKTDDQQTGDVKPGSTAKVVMSKFGDPIEYRWSDFKRVTAHDASDK